MTDVYDGISAVFGIGDQGQALGSLQLIARAVTLYLVTLAVIRLARHPFFGESVAFDVVLGFILGSMLSRAIDGDDTLLQTMTAACVMLVVHGLVRYAGGRGALDDAPTQEAVGTLEPASSALAPTQLPAAPGALIALPQLTEPRVLEVQVAEGVQTVRIAIG